MLFYDCLLLILLLCFCILTYLIDVLHSHKANLVLRYEVVLQRALILNSIYIVFDPLGEII